MKKQVVSHDNNLLTEISVDYYQENMTQEEIAHKYGISRIKVGRLLKKAREEGIVDITVRYHPIFSSRLEQELIDAFGIKRALIALDSRDENEQRRQIAALVTNYLSTSLKNNQSVTVSYGRNVAAVAKYLGNITEKRCHFITGIGGLNLADSAINADQTAHAMAHLFAGSSETLYAPAYPESAAIKETLLQSNLVKETLKRAQQADFAIVEIDSLADDNNLIKAGLFSAKEFDDMQRDHDAACELAGFGLFNSQGQPIPTALSQNTIGLSVEDLKNIPCVIGITSENTKAMAILAALRSGLIHVIATSVYNAKTVLSVIK